MDVPKHLQLVQINEKLLFWCAQVTQWCEDWTGSFENFNSDLRNVPKRLRKTVIDQLYTLFIFWLNCNASHFLFYFNIVLTIFSSKGFDFYIQFCDTVCFLWFCMLFITNYNKVERWKCIWFKIDTFFSIFIINIISACLMEMMHWCPDVQGVHCFWFSHWSTRGRQ